MPPILLTVILSLLLCLVTGTGWADDSNKPSIFVSILPQKYLVERVGGEHVRVSVMVGPGHNPATYEPSPRQMTALAHAKLYYRIGVPFEKFWMDRIRAVNSTLSVLDARDGLRLREMEPAGGHHHDYNHSHEKGLNLDPHTWLDPLRFERMAAGLRDRLSELEPTLRPEFEANYRALSADLHALDDYVRRRLAGLEPRVFMVYHPSWGYFADRYRLRQLPLESEGKEPGGRTLARLIEQARSERIRVIFVQPQFSQTQARELARMVGARVEVMDPLAEDYLTNLRRVADVIAGAQH